MCFKETQIKLGRVGKDRPTGIDFLEEASTSPTEKIPEPWPRPDTGGRSPWETLPGPCKGPQADLGRPHQCIGTGASEGIF